MNPNQSHIAGLELALQQWSKGGPAAYFAAQLGDLIAQAKAASVGPMAGIEQVNSAWLAQLRAEYLTFSSECQRLTAENARLRQHKNEYMEAAEETRRALSDRLTELEAKQADHSAHHLNMVGADLETLAAKLYPHLNQWKPTTNKAMEAKSAVAVLLGAALSAHAQQVKP